MDPIIDASGATYPTPGLYTHYKGNHYQVLGVVTHSETEEKLVVYQALYAERGFWARPLSMFLETVIIDGEERQRFSLLRAEGEGLPSVDS